MQAKPMPTCLPSQPDPMRPAVVSVRSNRPENHDTFTLTLDVPNPAWSCLPGQFNMLYAFGAGEVAISISGDPDIKGTSIVHTIRKVGSVTGILSTILPGQSLGLRGPFGTAWPVDAARGKDVVIVTGGIGLAPLRPALYTLINHRNDYGRIILLHGSRTPEDLIYTEQLDAWHQSGLIEVFRTVDRVNPVPDDATSWTNSIGPVTCLFPRIQINPSHTIAFLCGPEIMMRFALRELEKRGLRHEQVHVTLERNMQCAIGLCGHCQLGPNFLCLDGPVFRYDKIRPFFEIKEA